MTSAYFIPVLPLSVAAEQEGGWGSEQSPSKSTQLNSGVSMPRVSCTLLASITNLKGKMRELEPVAPSRTEEGPGNA